MNMNATLIIIRGVPGSGKSYIATALAESIGIDAVVTLDPDKIDVNSDGFQRFSKQLASEGVDGKFHPFRFLRQTGYDGIAAGKTVIWNQAFNDFNGFEITVTRMKEFAEAHDIQLRLLVVEVEIDKETAQSRIQQRASTGGHDVPDEKLESFFAGYGSFAGRGYDTVTVSGADKITDIVAVIQGRIAE
jgi:predicted kinase